MTARILIVDDNPANLSLMEYLLSAYGYAVLSAADGRGGVHCAVSDRPDLVLMDIQMPGLDGFEALRAIRAACGHDAMPVVAVTAEAMVGDRERILDRGFDGYLAKPIVPEQFVGQVEAFLPVHLRTTGLRPGAER